MSSNKNEDRELPDGWVLCPSKSNPGRKYFFNKKTGKSSWTKPQASEKCRGHSKHRNRKYKTKKEDKSKRDEPPRVSLKRKSDGYEEVSAKKRHKEGILVYEHPIHEMHTPIKRSEKHSPSKSCSSSKKVSPTKSSLNKNTANCRLSQLRAQLNAEAEREEASHLDHTSQKVNAKRISPNSTQTETQSKIIKTEVQSPVLNDSKCSTATPSPSSDGVQSTPSPSQFFAANKIISSMKAQLPDKYCDKSNQNNTFADIEAGICNQTPEYPCMKHPATPPQFSEASKLMSAIKSKLSYKMPSKDTDVKNFSSAQDRMSNLRNRLSNEIGIDKDGSLENSISNENVCSEAMDVDYVSKEAMETPSVQFSKNSGANKSEDLVVVVDTNVFIHELDFIKNVLNSHIKGQSLRDANSHIYPCELPDDEILNCCLQQSERGKSVILLSNDKNLCNKAVINGVKSISLAELRPLLEAPPRVTAAGGGDLAGLHHHRTTLYHLLANILENEMRAKYDNLWQHVLFKAPPWTLSDVLQCLLKHWIAVFNEVFPRIEHLITDLKNALISIESKDPKSLSQSEVTNFKELCVDVARKCQIIPEYMELAKRTVEKLQRPPAAVQAFEALWTVFSGYCSKVSSGATGAVSSDPPQLASTARALSGALYRAVSTETVSEEQVLQLEAAVREGLALIDVDCTITTEDLRTFCTNCGNMLQEAYTKFSQLTEVLDNCLTSISDV
ncbi:transcriptional protein SWT1-like [Achroia grisella]|uniref:transcriptional protein SWT1-like n=1 Tax=Achroia grisella TaxID=688607 RepID=UPI0027D1F047|nr:transcriptional protein SWT1-like [Achroia grisella]